MEPQQTVVTIPSAQVELDGDSYSITLCGDASALIETGHHFGQDITSFIVTNAPTYLNKIHIIIGGSRVASFEREDFITGKNLFPQGLPVSKSYYHIAKVSFEYEHEYVMENEEFVMEDEYIEEPVLSEEEEEFYDGCDYIWGRRVVGHKMVPTGRQVKKVIKRVLVDIPTVSIEVSRADEDTFDMPARVPVWESLFIDQNFINTEYLNRLIEKHRLHVPNDEDINEVYNKGKPFTAKVRNFINFMNGMAAKVYVF